MITTLTLKCPNCGGELKVEANREFCFCQYCGTKILLSDENNKTININKTITKNTTITNRKIDDAEIIRAQTERLVAEHGIKKDKLRTFVFNSPSMGVIAIALWVLLIVAFSMSWPETISYIIAFAALVTSVVAFIKWIVKSGIEAIKAHNSGFKIVNRNFDPTKAIETIALGIILIVTLFLLSNM